MAPDIFITSLQLLRYCKDTIRVRTLKGGMLARLINVTLRCNHNILNNHNVLNKQKLRMTILHPIEIFMKLYLVWFFDQ